MQWLALSFKDLIDILSNLAVAVAAVFGILGLWTWRSELIGKTKFEVARKMMMLALQFRDEYGRARDFITYGGESAERKKDEGETQNEGHVLDEFYAHSRRLIPLQETLRKFYEVSWEAEVILSDKDAKLVQLFEQLFKDLYITIEMFFEAQLYQAKHSGLGETANEIDFVNMKKWRHIIYGRRDDELSQLADDAANTVKKQLKKYIR
jgi:hypothetical protein